jgi:hypothetical protein
MDPLVKPEDDENKQYFLLISLPIYFNCGVVSLIIFLEKTRQKSVIALESLRFQGRSP